jgi:outer membrane protein assembly factor BamB
MSRLHCAALVLAALFVAQALTACGSREQATPQVAVEQTVARRAPAAASSSTAYSDAVLASAPVAYYRLDDTGSTATDSSPSGLSGAIGSSVVRGAAGLVSSNTDTAMTFPGTQNASGAVVVPPSPTLQATSKVSVELFLRFSKTPANFAVPVSYGSDSTDAPYDLYFLGSGKIAAQFTLSTGVAVATSGVLQPNTTYYVVSTYDGTTARLYINGTLVGSTAKTGTLTGYDGKHGLAIGDDAGFSDPGYGGSVDEVAVYTKALAASDITAHYAAASSKSVPTPTPTATATPTAAPTTNPTTAPSDVYSRAVLADKPLAYYRLNDSGSTALDSSTNALNGAIGSTVTKGVTGLVASSSDTALSFPATRSAAGTVVVAPSKVLQPQAAVSIELFLRFAHTPSDLTVPVSYGSDYASAPYDLYFKSGKIGAQFTLTSGVLTAFSSSALQPNTTYDVVATFDGSTAHLYLNGASAGTSAKTGTLSAYDTTHGLAIGDDAGFSDPAFAGTIGEVSIYGTALSAGDVAGHYAASKSGAVPTSTPTGAPTANPTANPTSAPTSAPTSTPTSQPQSSYVDWSTFAFDMARSGYNPSETGLGLGNVSSLKLLWSQNLPAAVTSQPILASGVTTSAGSENILYVGSTDGTFEALDADTGSVVWQNKFGSVSYSCGQTGVNRSAAFDRASNRVYFEDGQEHLHALDMGSGKEVSGWPVTVGGKPGLDLPHGAMNYNPGNHSIYTTTSSSCDISPWHGSVVAISTQSAAVLNTFFTVPGGSGGGIWGQGGVSIDPGSGNVFAAVGNADTSSGASQNLDYSENVLSLSPNLSLIGANYPGVPPYDLLPGSTPQGSDDDEDFGATPMLYTGPDGSACAAAINKSGLLVLYNRANIAGGYTQYLTVNPPTDDADLVGLPAYAPSTTLLYVPLPNDFTAGATTYMHGLAAFKAQSGCTVNGTPAWNTQFGILPSQTSLDDPHSPPTIANGVVYVGDGPNDHAYALNALTGSMLWTSPSISGAYVPPVADHNLYVASYGGTIYAFGTASNVTQSRRLNSASHIAPARTAPRQPRWSQILREFARRR